MSPNQASTSVRLQRPTQAVILAGGRGTRLAPLTDHQPKPMIQFHGKPFLEYLILMLKDQGFERVLLLLGYMPEPIQEYFGDGSRWGLSIDYSVSDVDDDTGRRIKLAEPRIDPIFLLAYCDNYWPMLFNLMWGQFATAGAPALVTVYRNQDGYTKDNLRVDDSGFVVEYDKTRTATGLSGVDIGFLILKHSLLEMIPDQNVSFEGVVYPHLVAKQQLQAYVTDHRYYSVGSHGRLPMTDEFLARRPAVLLDRDGVLNKKPPVAHYIRTWAEWEWLPGAKEALTLLNQAGYRVILISNQSGIARGEMTDAELEDIHRRMRAEVQASGGEISAIYYCPHGWDDDCLCRKPKPGMLHQAQRDFHLDLTRTFFIGDDERDGQAGEAAGCPWALVSEDVTLLQRTRELLDGKLRREGALECRTAS